METTRLTIWILKKVPHIKSVPKQILGIFLNQIIMYYFCVKYHIPYSYWPPNHHSHPEAFIENKKKRLSPYIYKKQEKRIF